MKILNGTGRLYTRNREYLCDTSYSISIKRNLLGIADIKGTISDINFNIGKNLAGSYILRLDDDDEVNIVIVDARGIKEGNFKIRVNSLPKQVKSNI